MKFRLLMLFAAANAVLSPTMTWSQDPIRPLLTVSTSKIHKPLPESLTSFGAAVVDDYLYVFSGHSGEAHGFGKDLLVNHFRKIRFDDPQAEWEELAMHDSAQSTALVSDGVSLYRIGGLSFLNGEKENEVLFNSTAYFTRYDLENDNWTELPPLPVPRSSHDAAVVGRTVYVVGGWNLQGEGSRDAPWHDKMHAFDLDDPDAGWQTLDGPGYDLRALSAASHQGKLYVAGGISPTGFLRKTFIYDPAQGEWTQGPDLFNDSAMTGFATSMFAAGDYLYCTGASGVVYRLADDGGAWEVADRLLFPRMFLRLLPVGTERLIAVGGTGGMIGRTAAIESLSVDPKSKVGPKLVSWSLPYEGDAKHSQTLIMDGTKLYAFGGNKSWEPHDFSREAFVKQAFVFDVPNQRVEQLPDMPMPVQSGAGAINRHNSEHQTLVVAGGMNHASSQFSALRTILEFDPNLKQWSQSEISLPAPRSMAAAVNFDDAIWIFGGSDAGSGHRLCETILHWWGDQTAVAPLPDVKLPHDRRSYGGARIGDEFFLIGGLGEKMNIETSVDVFDMKNRTWREASSPVVSRLFPSVAVDGKRIYLFGGFSNSGGIFSECSSLEVYDSETNVWSTVAESIDGVDASMRLFNIAGRLLFFGVDRENDHQVKFVLFDPDPTVMPEAVAAMNFMSRSRGGDTERNAKALMRRDTDKDGFLSQEELGKRMATFFVDADVNADKRVSFQELKTKLEADEEAAAADQRDAESKEQQEDVEPAASNSDRTPDSNDKDKPTKVDSNDKDAAQPSKANSTPRIVSQD